VGQEGVRIGLKLAQKRFLLLLFCLTSIALGISDGEYEVARNFVRFICTSCIGLG
jgi:hypothetical protein